MRMGAIIPVCTLAAVSYGIVHDPFTARTGAVRLEDDERIEKSAAVT